MKIKSINLRQPKLSASYKESVASVFQSVNITFLALKSKSIVGTPPPLQLGGGRLSWWEDGRWEVEFSKFLKKGGVQIVSIIMDGLVKQVGLF